MDNKQRHFGIVKEFSTKRWNGYIELEDTGDPVFFRYSTIQGEGVRLIDIGQRVSFELEKDRHGLSALHVQCVGS